MLKCFRAENTWSHTSVWRQYLVGDSLYYMVQFSFSLNHLDLCRAKLRIKKNWLDLTHQLKLPSWKVFSMMRYSRLGSLRNQCEVLNFSQMDIQLQRSGEKWCWMFYRDSNSAIHNGYRLQPINFQFFSLQKQEIHSFIPSIACYWIRTLGRNWCVISGF